MHFKRKLRHTYCQLPLTRLVSFRSLTICARMLMPMYLSLPLNYRNLLRKVGGLFCSSNAFQLPSVSKVSTLFGLLPAHLPPVLQLRLSVCLRFWPKAHHICHLVSSSAFVAAPAAAYTGKYIIKLRQTKVFITVK